MKSQLRYHATSGEWVLFSPKRGAADKPSDFKFKKKKRVVPKNHCPFEDPQKSGNPFPYLWHPSDQPLKKWRIQITENKFPALEHHGKGKHPRAIKRGIHMEVPGCGYHDLLITRNHSKNISDLDGETCLQIFKLIVRRYKQVSKDSCIKYVSVFQNWGPEAGATIFHPHFQIISLPIVPTDVERSLNFSENYFNKHKKCAHCQIVKNEIKEKKRIVFRDKYIVAFCPFASKEPFQVNIFPKDHLPFFEESSDIVLKKMGEGLAKVLRLMRKNIGDPDYNWFIHTSPAFNKEKHRHYHWHIEILPKTNIAAGFELGTGVEINPVFPEIAARKIKGR